MFTSWKRIGLGLAGVAAMSGILLGAPSTASAYATGYGPVQLVSVLDASAAACPALDSAATITHGIAPRYPEIALAMGQEGDSLVTFTLALDGSVSDAKLAGTSGNRLFDRAAVDAVSKSQFAPAVQRCSKIAGVYGVHVLFLQSIPNESQIMLPMGAGAPIVKQ